MTAPQIGIWFIGSRGGVASTATLGLVALQRQLADAVGLVTALPQFARLDFIDWNALVVGGHEVREGTLGESLDRLHGQSRVFDDTTLAACRPELAAIDARIRPGCLTNCGTAITDLVGDSAYCPTDGSPRATIRRLQADFQTFCEQSGVERVVVVNLASTEPMTPPAAVPTRWNELSRLLDDSSPGPLTASSLYAIAALDRGMPYINFTPSVGASLPAIQELAELRGTCHAGQDGKTGETLLKSVLAPMFAARNLEVLSWVGHNIFGNMDGQILDNPANKSAKIKGKDRLLGEILGYDPQSLVSIEYVRSMGDWKTAWDHIHFRGFLGTPMAMQFTWQGCDSLLAAPLVLDLVRFVELSRRRGESGVLGHLDSFFKQPLGSEDASFSRQFERLERWAACQVK